ncbi:MAG TPA: rhamnulose-1-phosphate aldolase [Bacteroidota bacterium]|nr:rhamnulose-1-phosphate aldolase [Bacteroidota bacterium]
MNMQHLTNDVKQQIGELSAVAQLLWERGWAESNAGNISINITGKLESFGSGGKHFSQQPLPKQYPGIAKAQILVTGAGTRMRDVAAQPASTLVLIEINQDGSAYSIMQDDINNHGLLPTSELATHLAIYQERCIQKNSVKAIVHTHPTEFIALTHVPELLHEQTLNAVLWKIHPEAMIANPAGIGFVPYILTGTEALAQATVSALRNHSLALWEKHGCIAAAETVGDAFDLIDVANKAAHIYLLCRNAGIVPEGLTDAQLEELRHKAIKAR